MARRAWRALLAAVLALVPGTASGQGTPGPDIPVDRVVAVVGTHPILFSAVIEAVNAERARGLELPSDSAAQVAIVRRILEQLVDEQVLINEAKHYKIEVTDADITGDVERQLKQIRDRFKSEQEYRDALKGEGFGTPEEYRKVILEQARRGELQRRAIDSLRAHGRMAPAFVSEQEITDAFERNKERLPQRPATVTFRQVIVAPRPTAAAKAAALAKADSLYQELTRKGADFEQLAKRESMDPGSRELGGDLGWNRRGVMVPEFERAMFGMPPGVVSLPFESPFGVHILRVDRVQPGEVKSRHILIRPLIDSAQVEAARREADEVAAQWRAGAAYDSLAAKHHDAGEERLIATPFPRAELPETYQAAFKDQGQGTIVGPFPIEDRRAGVPKFVVAEITSSVEGGPMTVTDMRDRLRSQLQEEKTVRRVLDQLRKEQHVMVKL